jgi:hypothetical protein
MTQHHCQYLQGFAITFTFTEWQASLVLDIYSALLLCFLLVLLFLSIRFELVVGAGVDLFVKAARRQ